MANDPLMQALLQRAPAIAPPTGQPTEHNRTPPAWKRFERGQRMIEGYANGWNPNPILTRIREGN